MTISHQAKELPAYSIAEDMNKALREHSAVVVTAPPGAGKSTLLPLTMLSEAGEGRIMMLEPRRLAARQVAERMADNISEQVSQTVGYTVRFESRMSRDTRIEVVTEGVMIRRLLADPMLDDVNIVVFDEFHERSLNSDITLALVREIQQLIRPELRIVIMSATIDATTICNSMQAPLIDCEGRMYDVETILMPRERDTTDTESIASDVCSVIHQALNDKEGDILVFMPGQGEIQRCIEKLSPLTLAPTRITLHPLYGLLSPKQQREAIKPSADGRRKIVLATSIAETSLTIEGIRVVIDSGFCRRMVTDPLTGLSHLETQRISRDMAMQRRGRAGRVATGTCYELWNNAISFNMKDCRTPEILDSDLSSAVLTIMAWGENDIESLPWLTPPPRSSVIKAQHLLLSLGAIEDKDDKLCLTDEGRKMAALPCHPRIARMLISATDSSLPIQQKNYRGALAADIAAIIEERDILSQTENDADINTRIAILRQQRRKGALGRWANIEHIANQYQHLINTKEDNNMPDRHDTGMLLAMAYPERIGQLHRNGNYRLSGGGNATVDVTDQLSAYDWIVIASMNAQSGRVFMASPVHSNDLRTVQYDNLSWNSKDLCVVAQRQWRVGRLTVSSKPLHDIPQSRIHDLLAETAQKEGLSMFSFDDKVKIIQRRITAVATWHEGMNLPDVSTEAVIARASEWLPMYAGKATTATELKKLDMSEIIWSLLSYDQQREVERLAPSHIEMPNGHHIRIDYRQGAVDSAGSPTYMPVLSVRLQECFGMMDTPTVDNGRQQLLMELLSPGFKPVQLTQDLRNFWATTYFDVRKELRRRYPKHAWPEDPVTYIHD